MSSLKKGHVENRSLDDGEGKKSEKDSCDGTVRGHGGGWAGAVSRDMQHNCAHRAEGWQPVS